jgi:hypothetical protein
MQTRYRACRRLEVGEGFAGVLRIAGKESP